MEKYFDILDTIDLEIEQINFKILVYERVKEKTMNDQRLVKINEHIDKLLDLKMMYMKFRNNICESMLNSDLGKTTHVR